MPDHQVPVQVRFRGARAWLTVCAALAPIVGAERAARWAWSGVTRLARVRVPGMTRWERVRP